MIRLWRQRTDQSEIIRLIRAELIPLSYTASPRDAQTIRELPGRLKQGVTLVSSRKKTSIPLGFIHFYIRGDLLLYDLLAVHPLHRGQKIGTMLMAHAENYGRSKNCRLARLYVDHGNPNAQRLYAALGFQTVHFHSDLRCYEMIKVLTAPF
jgi:GNAT superfamily N-acetyltransferase